MNNQSLPEWLTKPEQYEPVSDKDAFVTKSVLSLASVLKQFRLDDGLSGRFSPSAPVKMLFAFGVILLASLSSNFAFILCVLPLVLLRACFLKKQQLARTFAVALPATLLAFIIMLPAVLFGQNHSAVLIASKTLLSVTLVMIVALTTPYAEMTAGLRVFHVPSVVILTIDLALKNIVNLGETAVEVLTALKCRSVGHNADKRSSMGGVAGIVFLKANKAADETYAAMTCRGFDGEYKNISRNPFKLIDIAWAAAFVLLVVLFVYLQGVM